MVAVVAVVDAEVAVVKNCNMVEIPLVGLGYRAPIAGWFRSDPAVINCVEVTAEHFFDGGHDQLARLREFYPVYVHGLGLSLGTPGPIDAVTLAQFRRVVEASDPEWISEHMAFTKTDVVDLGHLNPVPCTHESLQTLVDHAREVMDECRRPLLLENITTFLPLPGEMPETEFINRLCETAGVGLLLDVTNLLINSRNHRFDPLVWLHDIEPENIVQLHIVGYSFEDGVWHDRHAAPIQDELFDLLAEVVSYAPVQAVVIERDGEFPADAEIVAELIRVENTCESARLHACPGEAAK